MSEQHYLSSLFEPRSVAVIGASERPNSIGGVIFKNIQNSGYKGRLYPINPKHQQIHGVDCLKSIEEIGARVDMAVTIFLVYLFRARRADAKVPWVRTNLPTQANSSPLWGSTPASCRVLNEVVR